MRRNVSVEIYRIGLMFSICWLHSIQQGGYCRRGLDNILASALCGFVFVSGWFGIRFSWRKAGKLLLTGVYCSVIICALWQIVGGGGLVLFLRRLPTCASYLKTCWFLWAYLMLMALAPMVDPLVETIKSTRRIDAVVPLLLMVYVWSYAAKVPMLNEYVPQKDAVLSVPIIFLAIYLIGRICAVCEIEKRIHGWHFAVALPILMAVTALGLHHMNSIFAVLLSAMMFMLFKRVITLRNGGGVSWITPSLFSVYLIHTNGAGFELIHRMEAWAFEEHKFWFYPTTFCVAMVLFLGCILLDMPRRLIGKVLSVWNGRRNDRCVVD